MSVSSPAPGDPERTPVPGSLPGDTSPQEAAPATPEGTNPPATPPTPSPFAFSNEDMARLDGFELAGLPTGTPGLRKGLREIVNALQYLINVKGLRQVQAFQVAQVLRATGKDRLWNLNPEDKNGLGFVRTIADAIGGHALGCKKLGVKKGGTLFEMPPTPGFTPEVLKARGIDLGTGS